VGLSSGFSTAVGLAAATHVIIPATLTTDGIEGVEHALTTLGLANAGTHSCSPP
jgi:hypothetical protein